MSLAIPMKISAIDSFNTHCEARGVERDVSLFMMQHDTVEIGDFVLQHVAYAIQKMTQQEAHSVRELFDHALGNVDIPLTAGDAYV